MSQSPSDAPAAEPLACWPIATEHDFKLACAALRIDENVDTGRMGLVCALARLQERVLYLERRLLDPAKVIAQSEPRKENDR